LTDDETALLAHTAISAIPASVPATRHILDRLFSYGYCT